MASDVGVVVRRAPVRTRRFARALPASGVKRDRFILVVLGLLAMGFVVAVDVAPNQIPLVTLAPLILLSGLYLPHRQLLGLYVFMAVGIVIALPRSPAPGMTRFFVVFALFSLMVMMLVVAASRVRVGATGFHGENLFVELRDRITKSAQLPTLPAGWSAESVVHSAHGEGFSGDFMVVDLSRAKHSFEVALVDVSGKGREAGTRSLLLSGALGALLGSLPAGAFLESANRYLVRQGWAEGFATAIHVQVDLDSGEFTVGNAGHPPAAWYRQGSGTWDVLEGDRGPALGLVPGVEFSRTRGTLSSGDVLMIYSDGLVESRRHDLSEGTDRMLGAASEAIIRRADSITDAVVSAARSGEADDRAVFVIERR